MIRPMLAAVVVSAGLLAVPAMPGPAHALPGMCAYRGADHIDRHGGKMADDLFHREHGEKVTCDHDKNKGDKAPEEAVHDAEDVEHHDDDLPGHRDHEGFHCFHLHCG